MMVYGGREIDIVLLYNETIYLDSQPEQLMTNIFYVGYVEKPFVLSVHFSICKI